MRTGGKSNNNIIDIIKQNMIILDILGIKKNIYLILKFLFFKFFNRIKQFIFKMKKYRLSIIVPCYNEENTLEILINKVLQQSEIIQEIIIIDDKSTDKSRDIILKISKNNNKVKYFF